MKIKSFFKSTRVVVLLIVLVLAIISIHPNLNSKGVAIRNILSNSSASAAGLVAPSPTTPPMSREIIQSLNNIQIDDEAEYYDILAEIGPNRSIFVKTNKGEYSIRSGEDPSLGLIVYEAPSTNIRKGLDLQGGTRVLLQPEVILSAIDIDILIENMKQRLNVYGLSDLIIREANDLPPPIGSGNQYIIVEIAGASQEEVRDLLEGQGKFEAKIGNDTAFTGGDDIRSVCRSADCAGIDPQVGCFQSGSSWVCQFRFSITLSQTAAQRQADITAKLNVITGDASTGSYLDKPLDLFLDNVQVDSLNIGTSLQGRAVSDIQISGSGSGSSRQEAAFDALNGMKQLQTLLITGSLPVEIDIVKMDTISPVLGEEFIDNAIFMGLIALLSVAIVIFIRYRKFKVSIVMGLIMISEVVLLLGVAALIGWNIDLAAIAGIIIAVGTGVDHQIVITDETLLGTKGRIYDWKKRLKQALFIIMAAYFTTVVAMLPLVFAGAGLLKGFAITTIIGVSIGVFITRPAYAAIIKVLVDD